MATSELPFVASGGMAPVSQQRINLSAILEASTVESSLQSLFHGCIKRVLIPSSKPQEDLLETMKMLLSSSPPDTHRLYMDQYMLFVANQVNHLRVVHLFKVVSNLVAMGTLQSRLACEVVLRYLDLSKEMVWKESLKFIKEIIGGVDYKGCRDLTKQLLQRFDQLPLVVPEHQIPALQQGQELLAYILNRNSALMPAYFAHDEIQRQYPDKNHTPHWVCKEVIGKLRSGMVTTAEMVSGIVLPFLRPVLGVSTTYMPVNAWRLDPSKQCCYTLKGLLPYKETLLKPQEDLIYYIVIQPNSKDVISSILNLARQTSQPNQFVEEAIARLGVVAMELSEHNLEAQRLFEVWNQMANILIFYSYLQLAPFGSVLERLREKLYQLHYRKGRGYLMWTILQYTTSTSTNVAAKAPQPSSLWVQKEFLPMMSVFDLLYQDKEPLPVPDTSKPSCVYDVSMASLWISYTKKAEADKVTLPRTTPCLLRKQIEWIEKLNEELPVASIAMKDYSLPLLLNIYNSNEKLLNVLLESTVGSPTSSPSPTTPLACTTLNVLIMHAKVRLMDKFKNHLIKIAEVPKQADPQPLVHALLESYGRLLVWLGTRNLQTQLIPAVFKTQSWHVLHALLELIAYRGVHLQLQFSMKFQMLQQFQTVAGVNMIPNQLFVSVETAVLRIIKGLNTPEFLIQLAKQCATDPKVLLSADSEELNKVFVLIVAQTVHIANMDTSSWLDLFMKAVQTATPHAWSESAQQFFPQPFHQHCFFSLPTDHRTILINKVDEELRRYKSKNSDAELLQVFNETDSSAFFYCVLWRLLLDTGSIPTICLKIVLLGVPKKQGAQVRKLVDYVVYTNTSNTQLNNVATKFNELVWKYNIICLDRLVLCMVLRRYDGQDAQVCFAILRHLLLVPQEFSQRVSFFVREVPPNYWEVPSWDQKHAVYLRQYPETFHPSTAGILPPPKVSTLPMYFGNVCLRFLPVLDLVVQRLLELSDNNNNNNTIQFLEQLLDRYGHLYKFHEHPMTYLYTTMHYYETNLSEKPHLKKKLTFTVIGSQQKGVEWYFTSELCKHLRTPRDGPLWKPTTPYYIKSSSSGLQPFNVCVPTCNWHFGEFSGPLLFVLYTTCVEVLSLPVTAKMASQQLLEALYSKATSLSDKGTDMILTWINAMGLLYMSLPKSFQTQLMEELVSTIRALPPPSPPLPGGQSTNHTLHIVTGPRGRVGCLLSMLHAFWHHSNISPLLELQGWLHNTVRPLVQNEMQLLFVCHLVGPVLNRLNTERPKALLEVVLELYHMLQAVDTQQGGQMQCSDTICDFLYHIKYMHIGDQIREEVEKVVSSLQLPLKLRLRFLVPQLDRQQPAPVAVTGGVAQGIGGSLVTVPPIGDTMEM
ncbi:hypothetical protein EMCRGX_G025007 [Ephydatia muelleri]